MQYSLILFFTFCILLGMMSSCEENEVVTYSCPDISGEWEWKKFVGGFGGPTITPESLGKTKSLIITDTSFTIFINDTLRSSTAYKCNPISNSHFTLLTIRLGSGEIYVPAIQSDTLVLSDVSGGDKDFYWRK